MIFERRQSVCRNSVRKDEPFSNPNGRTAAAAHPPLRQSEPRRWIVLVLPLYILIIGGRLSWNVVIHHCHSSIRILDSTMEWWTKYIAQQQQQQPRHLLEVETTRTTTTTTKMSHGHNRRRNRVLYIVTSLAEYDNGRRSTIQGYNRFSYTIVPVIRESVTSMLNYGYSVDVQLIAHYNISNARLWELKNALPNEVGWQVWMEATPIAYERENSMDLLHNHTRGLARQHRYIIKDKLLYYDYFVAFEDDMLIRGQHLQHYVQVTDALFQLRKEAPHHLPGQISLEKAANLFYGTMTSTMLWRTIPGFIRVEAALPSYDRRSSSRWFSQIATDYLYTDSDGTVSNRRGVDPSICCHVSTTSVNPQLPMSPRADDLYFWETSIEALGVRQMPSYKNKSRTVLDWVLLLGGNTNEVWESANFIVGDYWSGRGNTSYFGAKPRPNRMLGRYMSNQGGWMATRRQIVEWHDHWCRGGFLPPYDTPLFEYDGLNLQSVEYWSGGVQLTGVNGCALQRIVTLDPEGFSRHLLYHTSNNKQRQRNVRHNFSGRSINEFWGQANTIKKTAEAAMRSDQHQ